MVPHMTKALRIRIISRSNGVGLTRDMALLHDTLTGLGHDVMVTTVGHYHSYQSRLARTVAVGRALRAKALGRATCGCDVNFMIERVCPEFFDRARYNVFIPNPEWVRDIWLRFLPRFDLIAVKTHHAALIFMKRGLPVQWVGWLGRDQLDPAVQRAPRFLHVAGLSPAKGTIRLVRLWARHPEWPVLQVLWHHADARALEVPANVGLRTARVGDAELRELQNRSRFHLCPSRTEGYGHYIAEAMSVGAVCITTDAAPMNELVTADRGILVAARASGKQNLATVFDFDDASMAAAVERCIAASEDECAAMGARARAWYVASRDEFRRRMAALLVAVRTPSEAAGRLRGAMAPGSHSHYR